jgi:hypothetical protein
MKKEKRGMIINTGSEDAYMISASWWAIYIKVVRLERG